MRIILEIVQEMVLVLLIAEVLAAIAALPVWWLLTVLKSPYFWDTYWEAWAITSTVVVSVVVVSWVVDIAKGVNL